MQAHSTGVTRRRGRPKDRHEWGWVCSSSVASTGGEAATRRLETEEGISTLIAAS